MSLNLPPINGVPWTPTDTKIKDGEVVTGEENEDEDFDITSLQEKPPYKYTNPQKIKEMLQNGDRVFGEPGACLTWGIDGDRMIPSINVGIEGEKQTADTLARLLEDYPGMFIYHSLSWPESNGDTDHIVIYGDLMFIIDSKRWKSARKYSVTSTGTIMRGTVPFDAGKVKIRHAIPQWRKRFPNFRTLGVITIAQEKVYVTRDRNWYQAPYRLVENEKLEEFLRESFEKAQTKQVNGRDLINLAQLVVKERNLMEEIIRIGGEKRENDIQPDGSRPIA